MKVAICPTILATSQHEYREQMIRIAPFANRIQIDLMDGQFAPTTSIPLDRIWWDEPIQADVHLMYRRPMEYLGQLIQLKPHMVIVHFEAEIPHEHFASELKRHGIKVGLSLLKDTSVTIAAEVLSLYDHLLIFSGDLGKFGGQADLGLLQKVVQTRAVKLNIEIGWDGGINADNARALADGGVNVLNVGGFIQKSSNPEDAYATLKTQMETNI